MREIREHNINVINWTVERSDSILFWGALPTLVLVPPKLDRKYTNDREKIKRVQPDQAAFGKPITPF